MCTSVLSMVSNDNEFKVVFDKSRRLILVRSLGKLKLWKASTKKVSFLGGH